MDLSVEDLAHELLLRAGDRGRSDSPEFCQTLSKLIFKYDVDLTLESFVDGRGVTLECDNRTVGLYEVVADNGYLRSNVGCYTDILVLEQSGLLLGWTRRGRITEVDDKTFVLRAKALNPMPETWDFAESCPHMSVFGGWWNNEEGAWQCFGCGVSLAGRG